MQGTDDCAAHLRILFSKNDLGRALVLIEDRKLPAEATSLLENLPAAVRGSHEALYLHSLALCRRAEQQFGRNLFSSALDAWKAAFRQVGAVPRPTPASTFSRITAIQVPSCGQAGRGFSIQVEADGMMPFVQVIVRQVDNWEKIVKGPRYGTKLKGERYCYQVRIPPEAYHAGIAHLQIEGCKTRTLGSATAKDWVAQHRELNINPDNGLPHDGDQGKTLHEPQADSGDDQDADSEVLYQLFAPLRNSLLASIREQVVAASQKEAKRLKAAEKLDDAIAILDQAREMDKDGVLLDHLCINLCDRASSKIGKKNFSGARKDLTRVLELKPGYERAKKAMGTTYNNEACAESDQSKSLALFEKALEWDPSDHAVKINLALNLRSKAVDRVNASASYGVRDAVNDAIRWLERAYELANNELKPGALALIKDLAETDSSMVAAVTEKIDDETLKLVVGDLGVVYNMRARLRRGY